MSKLLRKPEQNEVSQGVTIVQDVMTENSPLEYVGFKIVDLAPGAKYSEVLGKQECCIVAVTGKINVTDGEEVFENLGTRESVFEKVPTDSV